MPALKDNCAPALAERKFKEPEAAEKEPLPERVRLPVLCTVMAEPEAVELILPLLAKVLLLTENVRDWSEMIFVFTVVAAWLVFVKNAAPVTLSVPAPAKVRLLPAASVVGLIDTDPVAAVEIAALAEAAGAFIVRDPLPPSCNNMLEAPVAIKAELD